MTASDHVRPVGSKWWVTGALLALLLGLTAPLFADEVDGTMASSPIAPSPPTAPATLAAIGLELEGLRALSGSDRTDLLTSLQQALAARLDAGIDSDRKVAAHFLSADIHYGLGDYEEAEHGYKKAGKGNDRLEDDAAAGRIAALEAMGRDHDAAKKWEEWERDYPTSPLLTEVRVARTWNALRRGALAEASSLLETITTGYPWLTDDPRIRLAQSTLAFMNGDLASALIALETPANRAGHHYLRARCLEGTGEPLKAAAEYQQIIDRFPDSPMRDPAMLQKANIFLQNGGYRSAAEEFAVIVTDARDEETRAEASLRRGASIYLDGDATSGIAHLETVTSEHVGTDIGARAQYLLGEFLWNEGRHDEAILAFNRVLTNYFEHDLAASAQYRVARSLDALERPLEATSAYQAVVSGYPLKREAPAAAYLAGVGLLQQDKPLAAAPYFQLVLDRYADARTQEGESILTDDQAELLEASLCLLMLAYHQAGDLGQLSGIPHLMLQEMEPSQSRWRAYASLIDADALASQGRYEEARTALEALTRSFPDPEISLPAIRLLAWTYAQQGQDDLAIETEQLLLKQDTGATDGSDLSSAYLNRGHLLFNQKRYVDAAAAYEQFGSRYAAHADLPLALYQAGLCYQRLDRNGDAVDRWETIVSIDPTGSVAEQAWSRAGDVYFQAEQYEDAKRCYTALLQHFGSSTSTARNMLRLAQADYNQGLDMEALARFSEVAALFPNTWVAEEAERGVENALYRLGQREDSAEVLSELVDRYPTSAFAADAQFEIATRHYEAERYQDAADAFRRVVSQFPGYGSADRAQYLMADAYARIGSTPEARRGYEQFLVFFPESDLRTTVQFNLGGLRFADGDYMRAAVDFTAVLESGPSQEMTSASLYNLGLCQRMLGNDAESMATLDRLRREHEIDDAQAVEIAFQIGDVHEAAGRTEQALTEFERALKAGPPVDLAIELHYRVGRSRESLSNPEAAILAYTRAVKLSPKSDPSRLAALARCAVLYEEQQAYKKALALYQDLMKNAGDPSLVLAATERAEQLEAVIQ